MLLPADNERDWSELEPAIREGVQVTMCATYADVWAAVTAPVADADAVAVATPGTPPVVDAPVAGPPVSAADAESAPGRVRIKRAKKATKETGRAAHD